MSRPLEKYMAPSLPPPARWYIYKGICTYYLFLYPGAGGQTLGPLCSRCPLPARPPLLSLRPCRLPASTPPAQKGSCGACQLPLPEV